MTDQPAATMTLADQARLVDAYDVAVRVTKTGARGAVGASTVEILAMAHRVVQLTQAADLTFEMLQTADLAMAAERHSDDRRRLRHAVTLMINDVGDTLEALGYGREPTTTSKQEEQKNGQG